MKRLIVNADDLGADEGRNAGILEAVRAGVVKSVSLLANGPATAEACKAIHDGKYEEVSIGVHLNLSEGKSDLRRSAPACGKRRRLSGKSRRAAAFVAGK